VNAFVDRKRIRKEGVKLEGRDERTSTI